MKFLLAILLLCGIATAQQPPIPEYSQYGSYSAQLTVYRNVQAKLAHDKRIQRRKARRDIRHDLRRRDQTRFVVQRSNYAYGDALNAWNLRRRGSDLRVYRTRNTIVVRGRGVR